MILETKLKSFRRVPKPQPRIDYNALVSKPPAPPKVPPKPGSKVYLYVYDNKPNGPGSVPQYYPNPHFTTQSSVESDASYPYAKEKEQREQAGTPQTQKRTGRQRVRDQGRRSQKGYKVLAEVTPQLRSSSRGGKMFVKQRQRMERFTKESPDHIPDEEEENRKKYQLQRAMGVSDSWATPWNIASQSPTAVKYITAKRLAGPINRSPRGRDPLGFLPRPPDFWRAKVEQNFPRNGPPPPLVRPRSRQGYRPYMTPMDVNSSIMQRPGSAPPMESPPMYENDHENRPVNIYDENDGYYSEYDAPSRPSSVALPSARIHFNAKQYYSTPHRRSGLRRGLQVYTTTPNVQNDFNARAKGWRSNY